MTVWILYFMVLSFGTNSEIKIQEIQQTGTIEECEALGNALTVQIVELNPIKNRGGGPIKQSNFYCHATEISESFRVEVTDPPSDREKARDDFRRRLGQ